MKYVLAFHAHVKADITDAFNWYEEKQAGLGERFLSELAACYDQLQTHPDYYSKTGKALRKIVLKHFPYIIAFEIHNDAVFVYSVFHTSRNPREIRKRMK